MGTVLFLFAKQKLISSTVDEPICPHTYICVCLHLHVLVHRYLCLENVVEEVHERIRWGFLIHLVEIWKKINFIILVI